MSEIEFQKNNIEWLVKGFSEKKRLLIADETGLGKTYTAAGVIAKLAIAKLAEAAKNPKKKNFRVLYICSGQLIARKNMPELVDKIREENSSLIEEDDVKKMTTRFGGRLGVKGYIENLGKSFVQIFNATPATSFKKIGGNKDEKDKGEEVDYTIRKKNIENNVKCMPFDLIILDEFQSYEEILSDAWKDESDKVLCRVHDLFENTKILLLSATPYRIQDGLEAKESLKDFERVLSFLDCMEEDRTLTCAFNEYIDYLDLFPNGITWDDLVTKKGAFEEQANKYIRRNQRVNAMNPSDNDFYSTYTHSSNEYLKKSYVKERDYIKRLNKINADENSHICDEEEMETVKQKISINLARKSAFPVAFCKNYVSWATGAYCQYPELFPTWNGEDIKCETSCKYHLACGTNVTKDDNANKCEKYFDLLDLANNSDMFYNTRTMECIKDVLGDDNIYKLAWLPASSTSIIDKPSKDSPFSKVPANFSKLLVFTKYQTEGRSISTIFSSKAYCKEKTKVDAAKKVLTDIINIEKPENYYHPLKCIKRMLDKLAQNKENGKMVISANLLEVESSKWFNDIKLYFLRPEIIHVFANAGIDTQEKFYQYVKDGDLEAVLLEYAYTKNYNPFAVVLNGIDNASELISILGRIKSTIGSSEYIEEFMKEILLHEISVEEKCEQYILKSTKTNHRLTEIGFGILCEFHKSCGFDDFVRKYNEKGYQDAIDQLDDNLKTSEGIFGGLSGDIMPKFRIVISKLHEGNLKDAEKYFNLIKESINSQFDVCDVIKNQIDLVAKVYAYNYGQKRETAIKYSVLGMKKEETKNISKSDLDTTLVIPRGIFESSYLQEIYALVDYISETCIDVCPKTHVCMAYNKDENVRCGRVPLGFATRLTDAIGDVNDHNEIGQKAIMDAFNSPFYPFLLTATDTAKEGISLHKYCRKVLHLNLTNQAAVMIQRNGRIDRYDSLAIRQRLALIEKKPITDWKKAFDKQKSSSNGMAPHWYIEGKDENTAKIEEHRYYVAATETELLQKTDESIKLYKSVIGSMLPEEHIYKVANSVSDKNKLQELNLKLL